MKKSGIFKKLFIITVLLFSIFLCVFMMVQTFFFKSFYLNAKMWKLEKDTEAFSLMYENEKWESTDIIRNVNSFTDRNNAQIAILDKNGNAKYTPAYEIVMETNDDKKIKIPLSNIAYLEDFQNLKLAIGSKIEIEGYIGENSDQVKILLSIKCGTAKWENLNTPMVTVFSNGKTNIPQVNQSVIINPENTNEKSNNNATVSPSIPVTQKPISIDISKGIKGINVISLKKIPGKITEIDLPDRISNIADYNNNLLRSSIDYWNGLVALDKTEIQDGKITKIHYLNSRNGMDSIILVKPISKDKQISGFIFAVSSLQPVGEAVDIMKTYYLYAFLAALILITIMALIFSKIIVKPLVKMNQVAVKMANLDFSEEVSIKSNDELGSMAVSLNLLSKNLNTSLSELKNMNEQLMLDIEKEKKLEAMRKEFIASVSHELKTPLGIMKGYAEGIIDNIAENKKEHYINVILDEIDKLDELVLDLLDLAKLESSTCELDPESFNIIDLLNDVEARLANCIYEKGIILKHEYMSKIYMVWGDLRRIEQVVVNIMNNAIRHTDNDGVIEIGAIDQENTVYIYIENSGTHIMEEDLDRIWERFYRAEKSRDRKTGGTGLGLSIASNILKMHGSRFGVKNTDDGVKFYFSLEKEFASNNSKNIARSSKPYFADKTCNDTW